MRLTIIADDKTIGVDSVNIYPIELPQLDSSIHAVQWYETWGEVEFKTVLVDGQPIKPANQIITDVTPYEWALTAWNEAKAVLAAEASAAAEAAAAEAAAAAAAEAAATGTA